MFSIVSWENNEEIEQSIVKLAEAHGLPQRPDPQHLSAYAEGETNLEMSKSFVACCLSVLLP